MFFLHLDRCIGNMSDITEARRVWWIPYHWSTDSYEPPYRYCELNPGQQMPLFTEAFCSP